MPRWVALIAACLVLCVRTAAADAVAVSVAELESSGQYKVRLAAALSLSRSRDPRAVIALATALRREREHTNIRRVAALALEKMIDARTADDARDIGLDALDAAAASTRADPAVRATADRARRALAELRRRPPPPRGDRPAVFVNVDPTTDQSKQLPSGAGDRVTKLLRRRMESTGFATTWPGGLPTSAELASSRSRAFIVAGTVKKIEVKRVGSQTQIACTVAVRVAPWLGRDGGERWEANRAASASGTAKAMTGNRDRDVEGGLRDCVEAVAEDVTARQVLPFLKQQLASAR